MKIRMRKALIALLAVFAATFMISGAMLRFNVNADVAENATENEILTIRQGASVRISDN